MIVSKFGINHDGKAFVTWTQYIEILRLFASDKIIDDIIKKLNNLTEYSAMEFQQLQDIQTVEDIAKCLGIKPTKTLEGTKARIKKHLSSLKNNDEGITYRI